MVSSPYLRRHAARCSVVPLGIDTARFAQPDMRKVAAIRARYDAPLLLFVGRLRYYKGLHILLDALPSVRAELLIGGSGPERDRLAAQARQLGLDRRVHFLGDIPDGDLPALFHAADVFVLPAHLRAEALGLAQIEALASGLPCVSTELGTGTSYANLHGVTGLVVPPGDPAALAGALNTLLADEQLRREFGAAGRRRATELFSQSQMLDSVEAVYADVLRN
jgi:rhamnosyl/mannosyltransferase